MEISEISKPDPLRPEIDKREYRAGLILDIRSTPPLLTAGFVGIFLIPAALRSPLASSYR
jgi:hypothetical protein